MTQVLYHNDVQQFQSWYQFVEFVRPDPRKNPLLKNRYLVKNECASRKSKDYGWYGTSDFEEAYYFALRGWEVGQNLAYKLSKPLIEKMLSRIERPDIVYDVEGISIDMGGVAFPQDAKVILIQWASLRRSRLFLCVILGACLYFKEW